MNIELLDRWLVALRSGDYAQTTRGQLRYIDPHTGIPYFCCLGVLCDIADPTGWDPSVSGEHRLGSGYLKSTADDELQLPFLFSWSPRVQCQDVLASKNDTGRPFPDIADFIEANYYPKQEA